MRRPRVTLALVAAALLILAAPLLMDGKAPPASAVTPQDMEEGVAYGDCPPDLARCDAPASPQPRPEWRTLSTRSFSAAPGMPVDLAFGAPSGTVTLFVNLTFLTGAATGVSLAGPGACAGDYGAVLGDGTTWSIDCARGGGGDEVVTLRVQAGLVRGEATVAALVCPPQQTCPGPSAHAA